MGTAPRAAERDRPVASALTRFGLIWRENPVIGVAVSVVLLLLFWSAVARSLPLFIPGPAPTFRSLFNLTFDGNLLSFTGVTLYRVFVGWAIGVLGGIPVGWMIAQSEVFKRIVDPYVNFFRFIPPIIWVTVFLIWFGYNDLTRVMLVAYATFMVCVIHGTVGMVSIPNEKVLAALNLGVKGWSLFWRVKVPAAIPDAFTGMRVAMTNSFMTIVAVEMLTASSGLGYLAWTSRLYFRLDYVFVSIIVLGFLGLATDLLFRLISQRYLKRFGVKFD